jgi:predicted MPP superfamily phosphohydrolase
LRADMRMSGLYGPSIQIDPLFPYYLNRSPESIAEEIQLAGYQIVHYFVVNENVVNRELIDAFHQRNMFVWAMVIGNGTFSTEMFPTEWPEWQMKLLKPCEDGFWRFSHFSEGYVKWKKRVMANLVSAYPFDGIEIAEPYFPEWDGIRRGVYGDVGLLAQKAFRLRYGLEMPDFINPDSSDYYENNPDVYGKWIEFRVDAVNGFIDEMINGEGGVREARADIVVATWSLAIDDGEDSMQRLREMQGLSAASMISKVKPDLHYLQTHWPDWTRGDLPADYVYNYRPFVEDIRKVHPEIPLGIQADIGSSQNMIKNGEWLAAFQSVVWEMGFDTWTAYEYHIGGYMYESRPVPLKAERQPDNQIIVSFNKRIDEISCRPVNEAVTVYEERGKASIRIESAIVDGNRLILRLEQLPKSSFELRFYRINDTPGLWLYKDTVPNETIEGTNIRVPAADSVRFAVMSDIHVQHWHKESQEKFLSALRDYMSMPEPPELIIINGDLTDGHSEDYEVLLELLKIESLPPVFVTMGNHEYYRMWYRLGQNYEWHKDTFPNGWSSAEAIARFLHYFTLDKPYYDIWHSGHHFIFLSGEKYQDASPEVVEHAWLSLEQLEFLKKTLWQDNEEQRRVFVFLHQPLELVVQREALEHILEQHPEVIFFSGHTHFQLSSPELYSNRVITQVSSSSIRDPYEQESDKPIGGPISESLFVTSGGGKTIIRGRRHDERRWVDELNMKLPSHASVSLDGSLP